MDERVDLRIEDGVAQVRLNRPDKLNALDPAMFARIAEVIETLAGAPGLRAVVLSGAGRGFCAGLDMASMAGSGVDAPLSPPSHGDANLYQHVAWGWRTLPVPVVAALHGAVLGGGLQIASGADIRIAAPDTRLSIMETKWGLVPDMAGMVLWRGLVREDVLRELTYTARTLTAAEGLEAGLITRIADDPMAAATEVARQIAGNSPSAVQAAKRLFAQAMHGDAAAVLAAEAREQGKLLGSPHQVEAVAANLAKRAPIFE